MRLFLSTILTLAVLAWGACVLPSRHRTGEPAEGSAEITTTDVAIWRRTNRGWERADLWPSFETRQVSRRRHAAPVHPLIVAGLMLASCLTVLSAFAPIREPESTHESEPPHEGPAFTIYLQALPGELGKIANPAG